MKTIIVESFALDNVINGNIKDAIAYIKELQSGNQAAKIAAYNELNAIKDFNIRTYNHIINEITS